MIETRGKRAGAGRRRTPYLYETQLMAARLGDVRLIDEADKLRAEADRDERPFVCKSRSIAEITPTVSPENRSRDNKDPPPHSAVNSESVRFGTDSGHSDPFFRIGNISTAKAQ